MSKCPSCQNEFNQPFVCITCGAEKLHNETMRVLEQQLSNTIKQNVLLRDALGMAMDYFNGMPWASSTVVNCKEALAATADLSGCIICDAEPAMKVIRNEAGQVVAQSGDGGYFDISAHVGKSFYLAKEK